MMLMKKTAADEILDVFGPAGRLSRAIEGYQPRESQITMATEALEAFEDGRNVVFEAPTGTGKSFGYLVPAALSGNKTIVSTATKILQDQIDTKDAPALAEAIGRSVNVATLKGVANYVCRIEVEKPEAYGNGNFDLASWKAIQDWIEMTPTGDLERLPSEMRRLGLPTVGLTLAMGKAITTTSDACIGRDCSASERCFLRQARERARDADIILVNHALLLQDISSPFGVLPPAETIVIDEAHHLEDWATKVFGIELWHNRWVHLRERLGKLATAPLHRTASMLETDDQSKWAGIATAWDDALDRASDEMVGFFAAAAKWFTNAKGTQLGLEDESEVAQPALDALTDLIMMADEELPWLRGDDEKKWAKYVESLVELRKHLAICTSPTLADGAVYVRYVESRKITGDQTGLDGIHLFAQPITVASFLSGPLFGQKLIRPSNNPMLPDEEIPVSVLSCSATIATGGSIAKWRRAVGMETGTEHVLPSPFDFPNQMRLYVPPLLKATRLDPSNIFRPESQESYWSMLAAEMLGLIEAARGGVFLLFTSNKALGEVHDRLFHKLRWGYRVFRQGESSKTELISGFVNSGNGVLFGVKSFWEGVDIAGDALRLVVIDKLPFLPQGDAVVMAREQFIKDHGGSPFAELAIPYAELALKQGVGRVIRRTTDRGAAAILDGRLRTKGYGAQLIKALPDCPVLDSHEEVARWLAI